MATFQATIDGSACRIRSGRSQSYALKHSMNFATSRRFRQLGMATTGLSFARSLALTLGKGEGKSSILPGSRFSSYRITV